MTTATMLTHEDAGFLRPGTYRRPYGALTVHEGVCVGPMTVGVVNARGEAHVVFGCPLSIRTDLGWTIVSLEDADLPPANLDRSGLGCCCEDPAAGGGLGECVGRGYAPPGNPIDPGSANVPARPMVAATPAYAPDFVVGGGQPPGGAYVGMVGYTNMLNMGAREGGLGKVQQMFHLLEPSSDKLKAMMHIESGADLTPQQIALTKQLMTQGVPYNEIQNILNREDLQYIAVEQQEIIPFEVEGKMLMGMGALRRAPIYDDLPAADIIARTYAYAMTPFQREQAETQDVLKDYVARAMWEEGLTIGDLREFVQLSHALGEPIAWTDEDFRTLDEPDYQAGLGELGKRRGLKKKIGKVIRKVAKVAAVALPIAALAIPVVGPMVAAAAAAAVTIYKQKQAQKKALKAAKKEEAEYSSQAAALEAQAADIDKQAIAAQAAAQVQQQVAAGGAQAISDIAADTAWQMTGESEPYTAAELAPGIANATQQAAQAEVDKLTAQGVEPEKAKEVVAKASAAAIGGTAEKSSAGWWVVLTAAGAAFFAFQ